MIRFISLIVLIGFVWGQSNIWDQMNKKKKALDGVKFEKQIHYKYKEKFGERIEYIANEIEILYNKKGDISEKIFDNNNRIVEEFTFNYDYSFGSENEKLIERITFEYD